MEEVLKQSPVNIDKETIESIFIKNNENVLDTLLELWNIDDKKNDNLNSSIIFKDNEDVINDNDNKNKWNNIRDICDAFDTEMHKFMKK